MNDPTVRGIVHVVEKTKTYGQNDFRKRLIVLEQDKGRFTNYIPIDFIHEGCDSADELSVGDEVEVTYRLSGRKWQRDENSDVKFFLNAEAVDFNIVNKGDGQSSQPADAATAAEVDDSGEEDEVPF